MLFEENIKGTAFIVGRFQPITRLHYEIIDEARKKYSTIFVVVVNPPLPSKEKRYTKKGELRTPEKTRMEKNPFNLALRMKLIHKSFGGKIHPSRIISAENGFTPDIIDKIKRYVSKEKMKENIVLLAGSDRIPGYVKQLENYLGSENVSIQEITRDMDSADNVSATRVREALRDGNKEEFQSLTPQGIHSEFDNLRKFIVSEAARRFFRKMLIEMNLTEGGLGGHMLHPSDIDSKEEFIEFFDKFLAGELTATEKVDGFNLFVGYNDKGKVVAARNPNEEPFEDVEQRFRLSHGGRPGFLGGFKAIKSVLERLPNDKRKEFELIDEDSKPKNFINLEIIYGPQPNIVPYSEDTNFIVFHNLSGTKENGYRTDVDGDVKSILTKLANKAKTAASVQTEVEYVKEDIKRKLAPKSSFWKFKGPIKFTGDQIKKMISDPQIQSEWNRMKKELKDFEGTPEETREKMRDISLELGSLILSRSKSKISDIDTKGETPGIEGLVIPFKGNSYKITGDFGKIYRDMERPPNFLKELTQLVGNEVLRAKLKQIDKRNVEKYGSVSELLKQRNPKFDYSQSVPSSEKNKIISEIDKVEKDIQEYQGNLKGVEAKGWDGLLYDLQEFKKEVRAANNYVDLAKAYFEKMFWRKSKKLSR